MDGGGPPEDTTVPRGLTHPTIERIEEVRSRTWRIETGDSGRIGGSICARAIRRNRRQRSLYRAGIQDEGSSGCISAFFEVYNALGFGFLEHVYTLAMERELRERGHQVRRQFGVCVMYKGEILAHQRLDMVVDDRVVVEIKSTYELHRGARRQVYNYLRATNLEVGLLLHFGPEPKFYRATAVNRFDPFHPMHPDDPSS